LKEDLKNPLQIKQAYLSPWEKKNTYCLKRWTAISYLKFLESCESKT